jgi:hypothetical protein
MLEKKLTVGKSKLMSSGGRLDLMNSVLTSLPMFISLKYPLGCGKDYIFIALGSFGRVARIRPSIVLRVG